MARISPVRDRHIAREAPLLPWGPPDVGVELVEAFDAPELEYAALRKSAALLDQPNRGLVEVTGPDAVEFLNRMVTQELAGFDPWSVRRSFWLNRRGRIVSDLRLIAFPDRLLLDLETHAATPTVQSLTEYLFAEDCELRDATDEHHRFAIHGPGAAQALRSAELVDGPPLDELQQGHATSVRLQGASVVVFRDDTAGVPGFELIVGAEQAEGLWQALLDAVPPQTPGKPPILRPIGWHAYNVARIEGGTPLFMLDFGTDSLPAETGVLDSRVSFTKGCFLGQEVVARMHSRGRAAKSLVAIRFDQPAGELQPETATPLVATPDDDAPTIGQITSSAISPLLGSVPIAFAIIKSAHAEPGTTLHAAVGANRLPGVVRPELAFVKDPAAPRPEA